MLRQDPRNDKHMFIASVSEASFHDRRNRFPEKDENIKIYDGTKMTVKVSEIIMTNQETWYFSSFSTSIGNVYIAKNPRGICRISFPCHSEEDFLSDFPGKPVIRMERNNLALKYEIGLLGKYFKGKQVRFDFPLDVSQGTLFQKRVWEKLQEIPYGERRSYKWVAEQIGNPNAVRAIGMANNKNPLPPVIPCHRVIGSDGGLTGYASGLPVKKFLLDMEYHTMKNITGNQKFMHL